MTAAVAAPAPPAPPFDSWLLFAGGGLLALGLLMVTSASIPLAADQVDQPFYYLIRQGAYIAAGIVLGSMAVRLPMAFWQERGPLLLFGAMALLGAVLVPGIGREVNGSMRWISVGPINIQVSEIAKLCALIYLAGYVQRHRAALRSSTMAMIRPLLLFGVLALLLLLEPDFGTCVVMLATALGVLFLAGVNLWRFAALQGLVLAAMTVVLYSSPYRRARLVSFLDPWADPFNSGFQLTQSLIAIGRGELFGVGLGASVQKLFYLPEAHTDFLFAVLAEELGFVGVLALMALYGVIVWRAFAIAAQGVMLGQHFSGYLAYGIGLWLAIQALFNMGVNMGALPTKGLTLPLLSYGGSSVVILCVALALLLRIGQEVAAAQAERTQRRAAADEERRTAPLPPPGSALSTPA